MTKIKKIGIIGAGNMGSAIISGISKTVDPQNILAYDTDKNKISSIKNEFKINAADEISNLAAQCDLIIIAVKPDKVAKVLSHFSSYNGILLSVAAGISLDTMRKAIGDKKFIRAMPNTPALVGAGMTAISPSQNITEEEINEIKELFASIGKVLLVEEKHMNAVTALSGSGPAYVFTIIQALADSGVKMGLSRSDSLLLAGQTLFGASKMFLDKMENPIKLRDNVTSPGGTTIAALHKLERSGFSGILIDAVEEAFNRAKELEKTS